MHNRIYNATAAMVLAAAVNLALIAGTTAQSTTKMTLVQMHPIMGIGEVFLVAAVAYHAYNGLRIIAVDLWPWATRHQRQLWWGVIGIWAVTLAGFAPRHLINVFSPMEGGH